MAMPTPIPRSGRSPAKQRRLLRLLTRFRLVVRSAHPAWILSAVLFLYILISSFRSRNSTSLSVLPELVSDNESDSNSANSSTLTNSSTALLQADDLLRARLESARTKSAFTHDFGTHFCILQPTLSTGKKSWTEQDARSHIAIRAFLRTFIMTVTSGERRDFNFSIYYGHDSDDPVMGNPKLRSAFESEARSMLSKAQFSDSDVRLIFTPLYGLHGRINAIWNVLAKDAYYDGCDYFFMSNDDMVFFTQAWVSRARDSLNGIGSHPPHKRPCRNFGIVRFKDEWASWATFTFHVSTRMHLEIFGGVYYPVPYQSAHNDYWINMVYRHFDASKYRGEVRVRNRVDDVDYALAHPKDTSKVAPPRYQYDPRGDARKYIIEGRARLKAWLSQYQQTARCQKPL